MSKRNRVKNNPERKITPQRPELRLSSYDPVSVEIPFIEIEAAEIEEQMHATALSFPEFRKVAGRHLQPQDHLLISMMSSADSGPIDNLTYQRQRIALTDEFIPEELKKKLLEMTIGQTQSIEYQAETGETNEDGSSKIIKVSSTVTIHEIQEKVDPEITDAWVEKYIPGATTVEEFRNRVKQQMEGKANLYYEDMKYTQCAAQLASRLIDSIPDELFEQGMAAAKQEFETSLRQKGMTKEEYLRRQGINEEQLSIQFMMKGRQMIAEGMALEAMAHHLDLKIDDTDIGAVFGPDVTPQQVENMRKSYEQAGKIDELYRMAACGKALDYVVAHAIVTHKKPQESLNPFG